MKQEFMVNGMSCAHCERKVDTALEALAGVKKSKADAKKGKLTVQFDENVITAQEIMTAVTDAGYSIKV